MKALIVLSAVILSGCATAWMPVSYAADKVCNASPSQQEVLAEAFDSGTHPHTVRVHCYSQVSE